MESFSDNLRNDDHEDVDLQINYQDIDIDQLIAVHQSRLPQIRMKFGHHLKTAIFYKNLANAYSSFKHHQEAIELYSESLEIRKAIPEDQGQDPNQDREVITLYNRLAGAHQSLGDYAKSLGDYDKALELYSWSLELTKDIYGNQHLYVAALYGILSIIYTKMKDLDEAEEFKRECLKILKPAEHHEEEEMDPDEICTHQTPPMIDADTKSNNIDDEIQISFEVKEYFSKTEPEVYHEPKNKTVSLEWIQDYSKEEAFYNEQQGDEDDIIMICDPKDLAKLFFKDHATIIWYNTKADKESSRKKLAQFNAANDVIVVKRWEEAAELITNNKTLYRIIISGEDGEQLVKTVHDSPNILSIYLYSQNKGDQDNWIASYPKVLGAESKFKHVLAKIQNFPLRVDFPAFAPVFDGSDTSKMNKLHFYLRALVNFKKREQAKNDLLSISSNIYPDKKLMKTFKDEYDQYDANSILNWYTKGSFLYKIVNNCLRIATSDSILYSRLIIKDLEAAIQEKYRKDTNRFNGVLYRATYLTDLEWQKLEANIGRDIEMYGFMSTSKDKKTALGFLNKVDKQAFISVIVPSVPDRRDRGFAYLQDISDYNEEEILFNIRSRFTVIEATVETIDPRFEPCRHLVLLYGDLQMREYINMNNPSINLKIKNKDAISCTECHSKIQYGSSLVFVNLTRQNGHTCMKCIQAEETTRTSPYLCVSLAAQMNLERNIKGTCKQYKEDVNIKFYGLKCRAGCLLTNKSRQYSCVDCCDTRKMWCCKCFNDENECLGERP